MENRKKKETESKDKSKNLKKIKKFLKQSEKKECKTEDKLDLLEEQTRTKPESNFQDRLTNYYRLQKHDCI